MTYHPGEARVLAGRRQRGDRLLPADASLDGLGRFHRLRLFRRWLRRHPLLPLLAGTLRGLQRVRAEMGAQACVLALLAPLAAFGIGWFGLPAARVLLLSTGFCMLATLVPRLLASQPVVWLHTGSLITGLLLGLTLSHDTPAYMILAGALVAQILGKAPLPGLGRNLFNPAALGRTAVAVLEWLDPPARAALTASLAATPASASGGVDLVTRVSVLFKDAGGAAAPDLLPLFLGFTPGAIGETSGLVLLLVGALMLGVVVLKWEAAAAMLLTIPLAVYLLPSPAEVTGHAPWMMNPLVFLLGSGSLLTAFFFATDPVTTPKTRLGGALFGIGAGLLTVLGRVYTTLPGPQMYGILLMNAATPSLDRLALRFTDLPRLAAAQTPAPPAATTPPPRTNPATGDDTSGTPDSLLPEPVVPGLSSTVHLAPLSVIRGVLTSRNGDDLVETLRSSGLGGCGGSLFPVADKWTAALAHPAPRILVVNGQEGEPSSLKDRSLMHHYPDLLAEGVALAAHALGATEVYAVVDPDDRPALLNTRLSLEFMQEGLGKDLPLAIHVLPGPGRYVAGEETALLDFLEGNGGEPRLRPPFPAESGLYGRPTVVHNVETLAWLPSIVEWGPDWFKNGGSGRKLVTLSGDVRRPGVYEVALGTPLSQILHTAGGTAGGAPLKALIVGGPSGGLLPPWRVRTPFTPEHLRKAGAMIGTGSIQVLAEPACLVKAVHRGLRFFRDESCQRCLPCRAGSVQLHGLWSRVVEGRGTEDDLNRAQELGHALRSTATCGLGTSVPGLLFSLLKYWPQDALRHATTTGSCPECQESA